MDSIFPPTCGEIIDSTLVIALFIIHESNDLAKETRILVSLVAMCITYASLSQMKRRLRNSAVCTLASRARPQHF